MSRLIKGILIVMLVLIGSGGVLYYAFPGFILESAKHTLRFWAGLERRDVQVDDHQWVYLDGGKGETILFVHGFGAEKDRWGTFLPAFSKSYRLIVPDLPGFGENSRVPTARFDIPSQVKRLSRFIEAIGLDKFHVVGISMGGYISAYYASEHPEKVKSLCLLDAAGVDSPMPSDLWRQYRKDGKIPFLYRTTDEFNGLMRLLFYRPPWLPDRFKDYVVQQGDRDYDFREKILREMVEGGMNLLESRLPKIQARTLIIWGANDRIVHVSSVEKFQEGLRNSQTVILDQCGHIPYFEKAKETRRAYRHFLAGLS